MHNFHHRARLHATLVEAAEKYQRLKDGQLFAKAGLLERYAQPLPHRIVILTPSTPQDFHFSGCWVEESFQDFDSGRFARSIRPQQPEALSDGHFEVQAVDGIHWSGPRGILLPKIVTMN